ncbi:uncharacterized protein, partial [Miscanthus floridulus]|uniref:uncharacterized protein n=1 Tax=Miscanthus floridulus TaxID=154761 RepID=UPI003458EE08
KPEKKSPNAHTGSYPFLAVSRLHQDTDRIGEGGSGRRGSRRRSVWRGCGGSKQRWHQGGRSRCGIGATWARSGPERGGGRRGIRAGGGGAWPRHRRRLATWTRSGPGRRGGRRGRLWCLDTAPGGAWPRLPVAPGSASSRRLLPFFLRSSPRRLPCPPLAAPLMAPHPATDGAAPGVVACLMGLESWPATAIATAAPPRPQKQRKVEASRSDGAADSAVVLVLPTTRSRCPPAPAHAPAARSHHGADLPARARGHGQAAGLGRVRRRQTGTRVRLLFPTAPQGWPHRRLASRLVGNGRRLPVLL